MTRPERHQVLSAGSLQAKSGAAFHLWWFSEHILRQDDQWSEAGHKPPNPEIMTQKMSRVNRNGRTKGRLRLKQGHCDERQEVSVGRRGFPTRGED